VRSASWRLLHIRMHIVRQGSKGRHKFQMDTHVLTGFNKRLDSIAPRDLLRMAIFLCGVHLNRQVIVQEQFSACGTK
jgi:hypothetical protein